MKYLKSTWSFVKKYVLAFLCGAVVWMLFDVVVTKGIDASFVSACMDIVTATVAVLALIKAKQIWDEKGKDVGYKYAMQLLTEIVPTMNVSRSTLYDLHMVGEYLKGTNRADGDGLYSLQEEIDNKRGFIKDILSFIEKIKGESIFEMNKLNDVCDNLISQINMCGIFIKDNDAGTMLTFQVDTYRKFTNQLGNLYLEITKALYFIKKDSIYDVKGGDYTSMDDFMCSISQEKLILAISICERLKELDIELKDNINKMKVSNCTSSDYFKF